ncbi:MAG: carboxylesterase family protein, partial [Pseudomonadales bacterium]
MNWFYVLLRSGILLAATAVATGCSDNDDDNTPLPVINDEVPAPIPLQTLMETLVTEVGSLQGSLKAEERVVHFQGIPYATPPVGDLRWQAPQAAGAWSGTLDATAPGPACLQGDSTDEAEQSEDCLLLNVAAPVEEPSTARPVMLWFHGGGDDNGSGHQSIYDIASLADATGNVIVSVNSRLGFLGFMALPELREESADASTGNYHHLDQVAALQWVQDNIGSFNGDPSNVTIFGESAGANDVCRHLSSRLSDGLFHHAVLQSSTCGTLVLKQLMERYT